MGTLSLSLVVIVAFSFVVVAPSPLHDSRSERLKKDNSRLEGMLGALQSLQEEEEEEAGRRFGEKAAADAARLAEDEKSIQEKEDEYIAAQKKVEEKGVDKDEGDEWRFFDDAEDLHTRELLEGQQRAAPSSGAQPRGAVEPRQFQSWGGAEAPGMMGMGGGMMGGMAGPQGMLALQGRDIQQYQEERAPSQPEVLAHQTP